MELDQEARLKELYLEAAERKADERADFLDEACADDPELRRELEIMLGALEEGRSFLSVPAGEAVPAERPGDRIGRYRLLEPIGEGGFGTVWMAEQEEPVRRRVALKVIKLGMDTRQVVARFEAERQALAMMDHPNIARVFDGGSTACGRPYFAMELVQGQPITEYCDEHGLATHERLELFQAVCAAVQHAHQKGVIHRDLKPTNVLVSLRDGRPLPVVIDFGIAKATGLQLTEKTLFTGFRQIVGTPEYMAPEQAERGALDVDTRADVYSLGVLRYELLTGTKPHDLGTLLEAGYGEVLRTIREVDPPKPSTRVGALGERLTAVAQRRRTQPRHLGRQMRGELDWIVMKALEKDRGRRYESASALAGDIACFLTERPVQAGPPSGLYRLRVYVRRHRFGVVAALAVALALCLGGLLAWRGWLEARRQADVAVMARMEAIVQRQRAERGEAQARAEAAQAEAVTEFLQELLSSADPVQSPAPDVTVRELLDSFDGAPGERFEGHPEIEAAVRATVGRAYLGIGLPEQAEAHLEAALEARRRELGEDHVDVVRSLRDLAHLRRIQGDLASAEALLRAALERLAAAQGPEHPEVAALAGDLGQVLQAAGRFEEAEELLRRAVEAGGAGGEDPALAGALGRLALLLGERGDHDAAELLLQEALELERRLPEVDPVQAAATRRGLAAQLRRGGRHDEAVALLELSLIHI